MERGKIHRFPAVTVLMVIILTGACSTAWQREYYNPIIGKWENERGIIIEIRMASGKAEALAVAATGYIAEDVQAKELLIDDITPMPDGGYKGKFLMPGSQKAIKVRIGLVSENVLMIVTYDRRAENKTMRWSRFGK